ncbi:glycosyltransferase family 2 protein [Geomonas nitrogeniifigens]|uniref:Glycosyltransferase family 2 protein n=1 Tax=Geomonas diazotrophica TaxID=2843197 RepID=A0ABX8JUF3_9BACT|nr:glycosyltransferase family 2 protein [Geomonas nitrogeniifigens]QWV99045.1 glycosyltransferase family 2 protein [Geomonas nitrogeniifigens]
MFFKRDQEGSRIPSWKRYINGLLAGEISATTRFYDRTIQWLPREEDSGLLLQELQCGEKSALRDEARFPDLSGETEKRTAVLLNGTVNHHYDIQGLLMQLHPSLSRTSRVIMVIYNPYLGWLYRLANRLGLRSGEVPTTFITKVDLDNIAQLSGYTIVRRRLALYCPWRLLGLGDLVNRVAPCLPLLRWLGLVYVTVLKPVKGPESRRPSLSVLIPARNERGNIENAMKRMPDLGCDLEVIFVEGHSSDGTWEEILRIKELYGDRYDIKAMQQSGKGKKDAVALGFSKARGELLTILDADLTMPPELLHRFYDAYCSGQADFVNGSRLVYPMEGEAMRFLNRLGNTFFAKALSWVLDARLGDSLCGTKLLARHDYRRVLAWREQFGDFDPFGDFELLFPAAQLALGITDVPIRYLNRTYGSTNISRFSHGFMLLKMTLIGLFRIKLGVRRKGAR